MLEGFCSLSLTGNLDFGEDAAVGEEGRGEGDEANFQLAPHPHPLPRSDAHRENQAIRGGEGAGKNSPMLAMDTLPSMGDCLSCPTSRCRSL